MSKVLGLQSEGGQKMQGPSRLCHQDEGLLRDRVTFYISQFWVWIHPQPSLCGEILNSKASLSGVSETTCSREWDQYPYKRDPWETLCL